MKFLFTAIILIIFHFASAQNDTSAILKPSGDTVLFTDFKPVYTTELSKYYIITIDKIEYTKDEMILYLGLAIHTDQKKLGFEIFGEKGQYAMRLISKEKIYDMNNIKNIRLNGKLYSKIIPNDDYLHCDVRQGEKLTWEIYFPRLPKEIKTVNLIQNTGGYFYEDPFTYLNIQIKSSADNTGNKKEKDLLNKMELNKPITLKNIYFETGKSNLLDSSFAELNTLFNILKSKPKMIIQISGFTDNVGKAEDNIVLSQARANAVKKYLSDKGIDNTRIITKGYGSSDPKASNETKEGRAVNRRVEITVLKNE